MVYQISQNGIDLIKSFECCRLTSYQDPAGVWTIGWGHTGQFIGPGLTCTQEQADIWLESDIEVAAGGISTTFIVELNQNQIDALISFTFNLGYGVWLGDPDLLTYINTRQWEKAAEEMQLYCHIASGEILSGLVRRRKAEAELFLSGKMFEIANDRAIQMDCLFAYEDATYYFNGDNIYVLTDPAQINILQAVYHDNFGVNMPTFDWNLPNPTYGLLRDLLSRKIT
ncbi:lysozyme [Enterococcus malodoratus]|uniref:lysozyme n=1 Tax=Enterococcus malodoratus TaxID=71451 RepID=UPI0039B0A1F7